MIVLVCGSRSWRDADRIRFKLRELPRGTVIIHGGARGADRIAAEVARALGIEERPYLPDWDGPDGKRAGMVRNVAMLDAKPDKVLAFWDGSSTGTAHTIDGARKRGIPVDITLA
jgi:hypothetical protein